MSLQKISIDSTQNQKFQITVEVNGNTVTLDVFLRYNRMAGYWVISLTDSNTETLLLDSVPMLPGINILEQYGYLKIGSCGLINISNISMNNLNDKNLGSDFIWCWDD